MSERFYNKYLLLLEIGGGEEVEILLDFKGQSPNQLGSLGVYRKYINSTYPVNGLIVVR